VGKWRLKVPVPTPARRAISRTGTAKPSVANTSYAARRIRSRFSRASLRTGKLANLLFSRELERRLRQAGGPTIALTAHPGSARTELNRHLPRLFRGPSWGLARPITHPVEKGALSILRAATDPTAQGGDYYGPDGFREFVGWPTRLQPAPHAQAVDVQQRLWETSEQLTGIRFLSPNSPASSGRWCEPITR
jgi:hypothetical protein